MTGIGHNNGPSMEPGFGFRRHAWTVARRKLLPRMPLEVINMRMRRAHALGLDFRTYATVRATSGRDIVAFLFSSNALDLVASGRTIPETRVVKMVAIEACQRHLGVASGVGVDAALAHGARSGVVFDGICDLPTFAMPWSALRTDMKAWLAERRIPGDGVLMVGETAFEREIAGAGGLAGFITGDRYFETGEHRQ